MQRRRPRSREAPDSMRTPVLLPSGRAGRETPGTAERGNGRPGRARSRRHTDTDSPTVECGFCSRFAGGRTPPEPCSLPSNRTPRAQSSRCPRPIPDHNPVSHIPRSRQPARRTSAPAADQPPAAEAGLVFSPFPKGCRSRSARSRLPDDAEHPRSLPPASPVRRLARCR
jgi:hypothetical protein